MGGMHDRRLRKEQLAHEPGKQRDPHHGHGSDGKSHARHLVAVSGAAAYRNRGTLAGGFYIEFLKTLDGKYPKGDKIRLFLDNLKVHKSEKVQKYISSVPDRFEFVFTPKHASWLNLVEGFFSKMSRQMLKGIRVETKDELVTRIYKYFEEINEESVVYKWSWHLDDIDPTDKVQVETLFQNV